MNMPIYQYSKLLKCWIFMHSIQITGPLEMHWFPKGSFSYEMNLYVVTKILNPDFMHNVKTIQISFS